MAENSTIEHMPKLLHRRYSYSTESVIATGKAYSIAPGEFTPVYEAYPVVDGIEYHPIAVTRIYTTTPLVISYLHLLATIENSSYVLAVYNGSSSDAAKARAIYLDVLYAPRNSVEVIV